ncbi:IST1-like protein [Linum perenne]
MSMLDAFFSNKGFKAVKCKTLLKLTIPRIKLLRNRREIQIRQMRHDIAKLLENGQEATARIRVEHIVREENMMAAQEVLELFCELVSVRLPIIEAQRECPLDLKEAISSICFAAPRCADLPELIQVQMMFASKYGKEFVAAATDLRPDCGVNRQIVELLSVRAPSPDVKLKLLKTIAEEHELDWDPAESEAELSKPHEDLLNGPSQYVTGSKLPYPDENKGEDLNSDRVAATNEQPGSDSSTDELDFPEVPKVTVRPSTAAASAPDTTQPAQPAPHPDSFRSESGIRSVPSDSPLDGSHEVVFEEMPMASKKNESPESKQFLPFITPPKTAPASASVPTTQYSSPQSQSKPDVDLHDILVSAQAAAETAERAAAAARSAAMIAQAKIKELSKVNSDKSFDFEAENPFTAEIEDQPDVFVDKVHRLGRQHYSFGDDERHHHHHHHTSSSPEPFDRHGVTFDSPRDDRESHPEFQRNTSIDEDPYLSYPNLFASSHNSSNPGSSPHFDSDPHSPR